MTKTRLKSNQRIRERIFVYKYFSVIFFLSLIGFTLLRFPQITTEAVIDSIGLCLKNVIPSLFPFMIVSTIIISVSSQRKTPKIFDKAADLLFKQRGIAIPVIFFSQIGGFPLGATLVKKLYSEKKITKNQSHRLLLFCINPGPAFMINYVGLNLLGSVKAGVLLYISVVLSSLTIGFVSRFFNLNEEDFFQVEEQTNEVSLIKATTDSVKKNTVTMVEICAWVILFSCINSIAEIINISEYGKIFIGSLLEVTNACRILSSKNIILIAGAIGWSGLCVHFQIMDTLVATKMKLRYFFCARVLNSALSIIICYELFQIFPTALNVSLTDKKTFEASGSSIPVSLGLLAMSILILLGDNSVIKRKNE